MDKADYLKTLSNRQVVWIYCESCGIGFLVTEDSDNWSLELVDENTFRPFCNYCWDLIFLAKPLIKFPAGAIG